MYIQTMKSNADEQDHRKDQQPPVAVQLLAEDFEGLDESSEDKLGLDLGFLEDHGSHSTLVPLPS